MEGKTGLNVLNKAQLTKIMKKVSSDVAGAISSTYGPFGANTLIQGPNGVYSTKDGWTSLQNLNYPGNALYNSLKKLFLDCAQSTLLKVGDGTSTVTLLANEIYQAMTKDDETIEFYEQYNVKLIEYTLQEIVDDICEEIVKMGHRISKDSEDDLEKVINNVALISTNWDKEMAGFITDIYKKTKNPIIKFENSGTEKSYVDYISGYEIKGTLLLKDYAINNPTSGKCTLDNPNVLVFGYPIGMDLVDTIFLIAKTFQLESDRVTVIAAPEFDTNFIATMKTMNMESVRNGQGPVPCILFKYYKNMDIDKDCVDDLCYLLGTNMIAPDNTDFSEMLNDLKKALHEKRLLDKMDKPEKEDIERVNENCLAIKNAAFEYLSQLGGRCEKISLTDKYLLASEFTNAKMNEVQDRKKLLEYELELKTKECAALSMITEGIKLKRIRLGKLQLTMGVIYVGGFGDGNLKSRRDALDDATRACEAVYQSGYTVGGGVAPLIAIDRLIHSEKYKSMECNSLVGKLITDINTGYCNVLLTMFKNKWVDKEDKINVITADIVETAIKDNVGYNLITEQFDTDLISPISGEIETLKGCMDLVMVMIGSNQMVFQDMYSIEDMERMLAIEESGDISLEQNVKLHRG